MPDMRTSAEKWLFTVPGTKKLNILILTLLQAANGFSGVLYALFLRTVVDAAVSKDLAAFKNSITAIVDRKSVV